MRGLPHCFATVALLAGIWTTPAGAAGFALKEQSATALGNAFAGATAGADDLSYMFFNPAVPAWQSGNQAVGVVSYILPQAELRAGSAATGGGVPIGGGDGGGDVAEDFLVPAFYAMWEANPDLKLALAVNVPFGLETALVDRHDRSARLLRDGGQGTGQLGVRSFAHLSLHLARQAARSAPPAVGPVKGAGSGVAIGLRTLFRIY